MEPLNFELTLEQELMLRNATDAANAMSKEDLATWLVNMTRLYILTQNVSKSLIKRLVALEYEQHTHSFTNNTDTDTPDVG